MRESYPRITALRNSPIAVPLNKICWNLFYLEYISRKRGGNIMTIAISRREKQLYRAGFFYRMVLQRRNATVKIEYWKLLWGIELASLEFSPSLEKIIMYHSRLAFSMNWAFLLQPHLTYWSKRAFLHQPHLELSVKRGFSCQARLRYWVIGACFYQLCLVFSVKRTFSCLPRLT